jgi:hypothetical protein
MTIGARTSGERDPIIGGKHEKAINLVNGPSSLSAFDAIRVVLGLVLLVASMTKAYALASGLTIESPFITSRWFMPMLAGFEAIFGVWLLSGVRPHLARWLAIGCFTAFAIAAFTSGASGAPSCPHCFGDVVPVSPWQAAFFDLVAVVALLICRPRAVATPTSSFRGLIPYLAGGALLVTVGTVWSHYRFGSLPAALAYFRGEAVAVIPHSMEVGQGSAGEVRNIKVEIVNLTDHPITILGAPPRCGCRVVAEFPFTLPAGASRSLEAFVSFTSPAGQPLAFTRQVSLYSSEKGQGIVNFWVSGRIVE